MTERVIQIRIRRQDRPESKPYWQSFRLAYRPNYNVLSALMTLREAPVTVSGERVDTTLLPPEEPRDYR